MFSVFPTFHKASAVPLNFWKIGFLITLQKENRQGFLLESEENEEFLRLGICYKFPLRRTFSTFLPPSLKLLEIRASNGNADSILTRAA